MTLNDPYVTKHLCNLYVKYIVLPIGMTSNNIIFLCSPHYKDCLRTELGIDNSLCNPIYITTTHTRRRKTKQKLNTICVGHHYAIANKHKYDVNKTWALLQTSGGKANRTLFLCSPHYKDCLRTELGIDNSLCNPIYITTTLSKEEILDNHMSVLLLLGNFVTYGSFKVMLYECPWIKYFIQLDQCTFSTTQINILSTYITKSEVGSSFSFTEFFHGKS
jgi:hypothetical protein